MQRQSEFAERIAVQIGKQIEHLRTAGPSGRLTVQALADRCTALGMPIDRSVVAKLEKGLRQTITVGEVLVLAEALCVPPIDLLFPAGHDAGTEVLPGLTVDATEAVRWFIGDAPLRDEARGCRSEDDVVMEFSDPTPHIAQNMRALRQARGWSCRLLAEQLTSVGRPTQRSVLANIESNRTPASLTVGMLFALAQVFDVDVQVLTGHKPLCVQCAGLPPSGYACLTCGRESKLNDSP